MLKQYLTNDNCYAKCSKKRIEFQAFGPRFQEIYRHTGRDNTQNDQEFGIYAKG